MKLSKITLGLLLSASLLLISGCPNEQINAADKTNKQSSDSIRKDPQSIKAADDTTKISQADLKQQYGDLMALIADKSCSSHSDCQTLAVGSRACGGPDSYEVYSTQNTDVAAVTKLAQQYAAARSRYNQENQMASICSVELEPSVSCVSNQCQKQSTGGRQIIQ